MIAPTRPVALVTALIAAASFLVPAALAGKGRPGGGSGGTTGGSYSVTVSPAGPYKFGEAIYVTTNAPMYPNNAGPYIDLSCTQNGVVVATGDHAGFPAGWYYNWPFYLGPTQSWTGGAANCTVKVFHTGSKQVTDATTSFPVSG